MKKILQWMFLLVLMSAIGTVQSQTLLCDFEDDADTVGWHLVNCNGRDNSWVIHTAVNNTMNGSRCLYITNDTSTTHTYAYNTSQSVFVAAYKEVTLDAGTYSISFDYKCYGEGFGDYPYDYLRVALVPESSSIVADVNVPIGFSGNSLPTGWLSLDGNEKLNGVSSWQQHIGETVVTAAGTYKLAFFWRNDGSSGTQPPAAVDNINFKLLTCPTPSNPIVSNETSSSATISWTEIGTATIWQLEYGPIGFQRGTGTLVTDIYETNYTLTSLNSNTAYEVYIESYCDVDDISNAISTTFRTECGDLVLPMYENFESYIDGDDILCWSVRHGGVEIDDYLANAYSGSKVLVLRDNAVLVSPKFLIPANEIGVHLALKPTNLSECGMLEIGFVTDTTLWDYVAVETILPSVSEYRVYEIAFDNVEITDQAFLVIRQVNSEYQYARWYVDDITLFQLGTCRNPNNFTFTDITDNSAVVNWHAVSTDASYQLSYSLNGIPMVIDVASGETSYTMLGLEPETRYAVSIRSRCDSDSSRWIDMGSFETDATCASLLDAYVSNITTTSASINWVYSDEGASAHTGVLLKYRCVTDTNNLDPAWIEQTLTGNSYFLTGLMLNNGYEVELLVICGADTSSEYELEFRTSTGVCGEIIGDGSSQTPYIPTYCNYCYSVTQSIYPSSVFRGMDTIEGIAYKSVSGGQSRTIKVFLGNVQKNSFVNGNDHLRGNQLTEVYSGTFAFSGSGWDTIMFNTPYVVQSGNLLVAVQDNTGSYSYPYPYFVRHEGSSLYLYQDGSAYNMNSLPTMNMASYSPDARFIGECSEPTCIAPSVACISCDVNSVSLSWMPGLDETSWIVDYRIMGTDIWNNVVASTTDTFFTISNLESSKCYEFRVGSLCLNDTIYGLATGYTTCGVIEIPYYEDFSAVLMPCWHWGKLNYNDYSYDIELTGQEMIIPANSYVILPEMNAEINTLQLRFRMDDAGEQTPVMIGVVSATNDISTFVAIDTVFVDINNANADIIVRMDNYSGSGDYIALMTTSDPVAIDDLNVEIIPQCPQPIHLQVSNVMGTSAYISWSLDETASAWEVLVVPAGSDVTTITPVLVNENSYSMIDLSLHTIYEVFVSAVCGDGDHSIASSITFQTMAIDPMVLPYVTNFNNPVQNSQWQYHHTTSAINKLCIGGATSNITANALYVSNDNGVSNSYTTNAAGVSIAYIPIIISEDGLYVFAYDWKSSGENNWDFGRVALVNGTYNFDNAPTNRTGYNTSLPSGWIAIDNDELLQNNLSWTRNQVQINLSPATYYLTFVWTNDGSGGTQPPLAIDNLNVNKVTCREPMGLALGDTTATSAVVSWNGNELAQNGWQISINNEAPIEVMDTTYTFTDLVPGMGYHVKVRTICGEEDTSLYSELSFFTPCGDIMELPYFNNFNIETPANINSDPHCWTVASDSYPSVSTQYTENPALHFYCYDGWDTYLENFISMPRLGENLSFNNIELVFQAKATTVSANNKLYVGVSTNPNDASTFTPLDSIETFGTDWTEYVIPLSSYHGTGRYVSFYSMVNDTYVTNRFMIDDVELNLISSCARPIAAYIESYTYNSAVVGWIDTNETATFNIAYSTQNDVTHAEQLILDVTSSPYTLTGLSSSTLYHVWVATECSDAHSTSAWVYAGEFRTDDACSVVRDLRVIDIDESHATLTWQSPVVGAPATDYIVNYQMGNSLPVIDTVQENYYFMSNLMQDSIYTVSVTTLCDSIISLSNSTTFVTEAPAGCNVFGEDDLSISNCPVAGIWNYGYSQILYLAEEMIGMGDTIRGVSFNSRYNSGSRSIVVYMAETDMSEVGSSFVPTTNFTQVYSGPFNVGMGVCTIDFTTEFIRTDHTKNLMLVIDDNTGSYYSSNNFYATQTSKYVSLYAFEDGQNLTSSSSPDSRTKLRPNTIFDVSCEPITCFPPSVVVTTLSDTQMGLSWRAGNDESSWIVEYRKVNSDTWHVVHSMISTQTTSITNLYPGTDYEVRVGSICGNNVVYRTIQVTTLCGPMPLPFHEDFEDLLGNFDPNCWVADGMATPYVGNLLGNGPMLRLYNHSYAALPIMQGNLNDLQIRLRFITAYDSVYALVGYMDNPNELSTFHVVDTIRETNHIRGQFFTVNYSSLPDDATGYIAIQVDHNIGFTFYDDIIVEPIRACVEPTNVNVTNITTTSADIAWTGNAQNYIVEYGESGFTRGAGTRINTTSPSVQLATLNSGTRYDLYVYAVCGAGDTSYFSNSVSFKTECDVISTLPYEMNFELDYLPPLVETGILPTCWTSIVFDTAASSDDVPQILYDEYSEFAVNGEYAMLMATPSIVALPEFSADLNTLTVRFSNTALDEDHVIVVGVLDHVGSGCEATFQPIDTVYPLAIDIPERYVVFLDSYVGTGHYIAFKNVNLQDANDLSVNFLDSIIVEVTPPCAEVSDFSLINATASAITFDWVDHSDSVASWEIRYCKTGFDSTMTSVIVNSHPASITGLNMLTDYSIWVRPICSDTDTGSWCIRPMKAATMLCDIPTISVTTPITGSTGSSSNYPLGIFYDYSYSQTIIDAHYLSDQTDITALSLNASHASDGMVDDCMIWIGHTDKTQFNNTTDWIPTSDMQLVFTGDLEYDAGTFTIAFDTPFTYDGTSNIVVAIDRNTGDYSSGHNFSIVSDSVAKTIYQRSDYDNQDPATLVYTGTLETAHAAFEFISCVSGCTKPILSSVSNLTYESATINWSSEGTNFEVALRPQDVSIMSDPISVDSLSYTFMNLTPNTTYAYYVRQVCEDDMVSEWVEGSFITADLPCFTPTGVNVDSYTAETVTLSWTTDSEQNKWSVHVFNTMEDHIDTVFTNPCTILGLQGGRTYKVAVCAICATNYSSEWSDTIEFSTTDCLPVSNVEVSSITQTSAKTSWIAGGSEVEWEINFGESGFGQGEGELVRISTNSFTMNNLEPDTEYDVYVRALCSATFMSIWSNVVTFTTLEGEEPQGIDGVQGNFRFAIYPNPTNGSTTITLNGIDGQVSINVVDMNGRSISSEIIECGGNCEKRIDVTGLAQGTYFVRVLGDNINSVRKLVVK